MKKVKMAVLIGLIAGGITLESAGKSEMGRVEKNKQIVRAAIRSANEGDFELMAKLYSPRFVQHTPGSKAPKKWPDYELAWRLLHNRLPTLKYKVRDIIAEGDKVAVRVSWSYTNKKYFGYQGNPEGDIGGTEIDLFRIEGGRIIEEWCEHDPKQFSRLVRVMGYMERER